MKKYYLGSRSRGNCLSQQVVEGRIRGGGTEVTGRRGRRRRELLDDLKGKRRYSHLAFRI
jgi:hypothetical protein